MRALDRPVRDGDRFRMLRGEVRRRQLDHLAGADEQHVFALQAAKDALRHAHRSGSHRDRLRADLGGRANLLRHREGALEQVVQHQPEAACGARQLLGLFHLPQDLRLAQHHRIQSACHAERMAHRARLRQYVGVALQLVQAQLFFAGDERLQCMLRAIGLLGGAVRVRSGCRWRRWRLRTHAHRRRCKRLAQAADRRAHFFRNESHALAHRQGRSSVIQSEGEQVHGPVARRVGVSKSLSERQIIGFARAPEA